MPFNNMREVIESLDHQNGGGFRFHRLCGRNPWQQRAASLSGGFEEIGDVENASDLTGAQHGGSR